MLHMHDSNSRLLAHLLLGLQGQSPDTEDIVAVRNTLLQSTDLRRMQNLEKQLKGQMNLSDAASESLVNMLQASCCFVCACTWFTCLLLLSPLPACLC